MNSEPTRPAGNHYDKYGTQNPIARFLMKGFLSSFDRLSARVPPCSALEVGCGEGELSLRLARRGYEVRGCDVSEAVIEEARKRALKADVDVTFWTQGVEYLNEQDAAQLVICCEVLEHLDDPHAGLKTLASLACPWLLTSVPREPLWRALNMARGKYLSEWGNTHGHLNHWSKSAFLDFVGARFDVVEVASPLPWTLALCRVK